jgi:hypothetical protein
VRSCGRVSRSVLPSTLEEALMGEELRILGADPSLESLLS